MNAAEWLEPERLDAQPFLDSLGGPLTFQTFDEKSGSKRRALSRVLHGDLSQHAPLLSRLNQDGAGVFVMVNEGNGKRRTAENVTRVRACFADLDGAPLRPVLDCLLPPHFTIETSPNRYHAYWLCDDVPLADFKPIQQAIIQRFGTDPKVCDLPRVMRLPGFLHHKRAPFLTRIIQQRAGPRYSHAALLAEFGSMPRTEPMPVSRTVLPSVIPSGERNTKLLSVAAGFVRAGYDAAAVNQRLQRINAERCSPPLCANEVGTIATSACDYGSEGFISLRHMLMDSPEWNALAPAVHDVILVALRRYNGSNNGNIALTWSDFAKRPGFGNKGRFYDYRQQAVECGILRHVSQGRITQGGKTPDLYAIADKWLHVPKVAN